MSNAIRPYTVAELLSLALAGKLVDPVRVLATFADPANWTRLYNAEAVSPTGDYRPSQHECDWAMIGPTRPPYELAQWALKNLGHANGGGPLRTRAVEPGKVRRGGINPPPSTPKPNVRPVGQQPRRQATRGGQENFEK